MQFDISVNVWAVLAAAVASMVVGSIWYGPLFGKKFMALTGMDKWTAEQRAEMTKKMWLSYLGQFIASFVTFYVLAWLMGALGAVSPMDGVQAAFWVWLGFVAPIKFADVLWGGKMAMFWLSAGNMLITLVIGGAIIGALI